jgi:hypothetical protein
MASTKELPQKILEETFHMSRKVYVARVEELGPPVMLFGVIEKGMMDGAWFDQPNESFLVGSVWMLGTDDMDRYKLTIAKEAPAWIDFLGQGYDVLANCVWQGNHLHIKWLDFTGFSFKPKVQFGPHGDIFLPFYKMTANV